MKLVFLCGSLEPGKDGVGDYTRRLARELVKNEFRVIMIALNDRFIEEYSEINQEIEEVVIPAVRFPAKLSFRKKIKLAKSTIDNFDPEWLSLQYVPFSFQKKGLPFGFAWQLKKISGKRKWHIMFHELWVGMNREASLKFKIWGALQKQIIGHTISSLLPAVISTQSRLHKVQLERMGFKVNLIPLFSNFKVFYNKQQVYKNGTIKFIVFGAIHPGAPVAKFASELYHYGIQNNKKLHFLFIGRCPRHLEEWVNICKGYQFKIEILGEQEPKVISEVLSNADFGISSTPFYLYEKSGTIAAMREHGLPILCVASKYTPGVQIPFSSPEVMEYHPHHLNLDAVELPIFSNTLEKIGKNFSNTLRLASSINI